LSDITGDALPVKRLVETEITRPFMARPRRDTRPSAETETRPRQMTILIETKTKTRRRYVSRPSRDRDVETRLHPDIYRTVLPYSGVCIHADVKLEIPFERKLCLAQCKLYLEAAFYPFVLSINRILNHWSKFSVVFHNCGQTIYLIRQWQQHVAFSFARGIACRQHEFYSAARA